MIEIRVVAAAKPRSGRQRYYVEVLGIPMLGFIIMPKSYLLEEAETIKRCVEDGLHQYRRPKRTTRPPKHKSAWKILAEGKFLAEQPEDPT